MQKGTILSVKNLHKSYGQFVALTDISFDVNEGELISIIGPSGAGKSTLLRCVNRMIQPTKGEINFMSKNGEVDIIKSSLRDLNGIRSEIGMIFQHYNLVYRLSSLENVLHGKLGGMSTIKSILGQYKDEDVERASKLLKNLGLEDHIYYRAGDLSGGQKQRVGIARALMQEPKLVLCDEPIASLDPLSSKQIMTHLKEVAKGHGIPCLVNLHQVDVAKQYSDRIIGIRDGEMVFDGLPSELTDDIIEQIYGASGEDLLVE